MLPDLDIAPVGFHDVLIENLAASPTWRSWYISPGDVTMAEGCVYDHVTAFEGGGAAPSLCSSSPRVGVSA